MKNNNHPPGYKPFMIAIFGIMAFFSVMILMSIFKLILSSS